jgi:hypothetical protein
MLWTVGTRSGQTDLTVNQARSGARSSFLQNFEREIEMATENEVRDFGWALARVREGKCVARVGWYRVTHESISIFDLAGIRFVGVRNKGGAIRPWSPEQEDMLTNDWELVE